MRIDIIKFICATRINQSAVKPLKQIQAELVDHKPIC